MYSNDKQKKSKDYKSIIVIFIVLIVSIGIFLIVKPTITGYTIKRTQLENEYEICLSNLNNFSKLLNESELVNNNLLDENEELNNQIKSLELQKDNLKESNDDLSSQIMGKISEISRYLEDISKMEEDIDNINNKYEKLYDDYDELAKNYANYYCCIKRFENPSIAEYSISNSKIICKEDNQGSKKLSCP
jgi:P-type conjugative transfer protein TrbJ